MSTTINQRMDAFCKLGNSMRLVSEALIREDKPTFQHKSELPLFEACIETSKINPWFTQKEISRALLSLSEMLDRDALTAWLRGYPELLRKSPSIKNIAVIMAGNIPLVGFHDLLCVIMSGHHFTGKLSSQDPLLPLAAAEVLISYLSGLKSQLSFSEEIPRDADAYIGTGSDNTARFFASYFADKPHIIRKNRSSIAVLTGNETESELKALGEDVFAYFGLGCRSVSHLLIPSGFNFSELRKAWKEYEYLLHHKKYHHNLKRARALFITDETPIKDMGFFLLRESPEITPSISVLNYTHYQNELEILQFISQRKDILQCVSSNLKMDIQHVSRVPLGQSQYPVLSDYADGVDTMAFLLDL